jgi:N-acetylneuraminic acid mutarotase
VLDAPLGDTWTFDGARWTRFNGVGPTARYGHAMATLGNVVVMFGGLVLTTHFGEVGAGNDTWTFDGAEWRQVPGIGPPPRWRASMATLGNKVVLFGGTLFAGSPVYDDTWTFDGTRWTQVKGAGPPARYSAAMTAVGNQVVLFGGSPISPNGSNPPFFADTWTFDGASWTQRGLDAGSSPHARYGLAMATLGSRAVLFSGVYDVFFRLAFLDDLWTFDASGWGMVAFDASAGPLPRAYPSVASYGARVVLFGGTYLGTMNDLWSYDGTSWTQVNATGPSARAVSAMATLIR